MQRTLNAQACIYMREREGETSILNGVLKSLLPPVLSLTDTFFDSLLLEGIVSQRIGEPCSFLSGCDLTLVISQETKLTRAICCNST